VLVDQKVLDMTDVAIPGLDVVADHLPHAPQMGIPPCPLGIGGLTLDRSLLHPPSRFDYGKAAPVRGRAIDARQ
jgi:hypothetical protein